MQSGMKSNLSFSELIVKTVIIINLYTYDKIVHELQILLLNTATFLIFESALHISKYFIAFLVITLLCYSGLRVFKINSIAQNPIFIRYLDKRISTRGDVFFYEGTFIVD